MNARQRDLFLYLWSRRRQAGRAKIVMRGAIIGALGGVLFTLMMLSAIDLGNTWPELMEGLGKVGLMLGLAVPAFGLIGLLGSSRVWNSQEQMYQAMLSAGARVPDQKPVMQPGDRWPAIVVGVAVAQIAGFILWLMWTASTGAL